MKIFISGLYSGTNPQPGIGIGRESRILEHHLVQGPGEELGELEGPRRPADAHGLEPARMPRGECDPRRQRRVVGRIRRPRARLP